MGDTGQAGAGTRDMMIEDERYKRQTMLWGDKGQQRLAEARVSIVGLDMQGVYAALCLAALGVGNISLIDGGEVQKGESFLGLDVEKGARVEGYGRIIRMVNPLLNIECYQSGIESRIDEEILYGSDVILETTNSIRSKERCTAYGWVQNIPVLSSSSRWGYTKTMFCDPKKRDPAYLMPMFEGAPQDELMALVSCGILGEETKKAIFKEREMFLEEPVRYRLGQGYRFGPGNEDAPMPEKGLYEKLKVAFLGGGALGCWGAIAAANMFFGRVDVYDYDNFESHNINRQVLGFDGIGKPKAPHLAMKIEKMSGGKTKSQGFNKMILPGFSTKEKYDLVFDFVDNAYTRAINTAYAILNDIPMISAGALPESARSITQMAGKTQCLNCFYDIYEDGRREEMIRRASCAANPNPSVVMSNAVGAAMALLETFTVIEPDKFGEPFNGELTYRSSTPRRFGTNGVESPCGCYTTKPIPDLKISKKDVARFAKEHPELLLKQE